MRSLAARFTFVLTLGVSAAVLAAVLPRVLSVGGAPGHVAILAGVGWALFVIGVVGALSWSVVRAILRPLYRFTHQLHPGSALASTSVAATQSDPVEIRVLRAVVLGREDSQRRQSTERSVFVSTIIHDLKTPLLAVERSLELALAEDDFAKRRAWLLACADEVHRLLILVQDVVDASHLASGSLRVQSEVVDLGDVVQRVAARVSKLRDEVAVRVSARGQQQHIGDPRLLERAIENVAANAVRHAREAVSLEVMMGVVRISDDGPGLPGGLANPGERFGDQGEAARAGWSQPQSVGLGFFIARWIAEAHGGKLVVESSGDMGSTILLYVGTLQVTAEMVDARSHRR